MLELIIYLLKLLVSFIAVSFVIVVFCKLHTNRNGVDTYVDKDGNEY